LGNGNGAGALHRLHSGSIRMMRESPRHCKPVARGRQAAPFSEA
jgi:hypothetical protein